MRTSDWLSAFASISDPGLKTALLETASVVTLEAGRRVFSAGDSPSHFLMVAEGAVVVRQYSERGRAVVLYRVGPGETCILTTSCLIGEDAYPAEAVTETKVTAALVPRSAFEALLAASAPFRRFVFASLGARLSDLMHVIDQIAFERLEVRLCHTLLALSKGGDQVTATQQELAEELGGAREAVNRRLADLARRGFLVLHRGRIEILDRSALRRLAETLDQV